MTLEDIEDKIEGIKKVLGNHKQCLESINQFLVSNSMPHNPECGGTIRQDKRQNGWVVIDYLWCDKCGWTRDV